LTLRSEVNEGEAVVVPQLSSVMQNWNSSANGRTLSHFTKLQHYGSCSVTL